MNENLPLKILYSVGRSYIENDFRFRVQGDYDFILELGGRLLTRSGVLGDVPIYARSVIHVIYPIKPPVSGEIPSIPSVKDDHSVLRGGSPSSIAPVIREQPNPMAQAQSTGGYHRQFEGVKPERDGEELYDRVEYNSLDSKSYDKIRQNFKCPKFSEQARDWKIWDKGFWRYLSIWELEYVLDHSLLLNELSNFRFLADETPTELCLRLDELFQELRDLPMDAAVTFIDTQKIEYLFNALRHEKEWDYVCSAIISAQIKGGYFPRSV